MKTIEEFYNEVMENKALAEAANKARVENRLSEFLIEQEVDGTAEAFEALVKEKKSAGSELSDDELEKAVGGTYGEASFFGISWSDNGYKYNKAEVEYLFNVNDRVIVDCWFRNLTGTITEREICCKSYGCSPFYYPKYKIKFDIDTSDDWYEQDSLAPLT
ncbi:MAG: hypothetical protein ACI4XA_01055 [Oscillospiraceae bacterium]